MSDNNGGFKLKRGEKFQKELVTSMSDNLW
jgi:hypothetical protein